MEARASAACRCTTNGCSLKADRREGLQGFRFIPIYATGQGARVADLAVTHHPRKLGQSKYGLNRTIKVLLDLLVVSPHQIPHQANVSVR